MTKDSRDRAHIGYELQPSKTEGAVAAHPLRHLTTWARERVLGTAPATNPDS